MHRVAHLNLSSSKSSRDDLWEVWSINYHSKVYWIIFHKVSIQQVFYSNKHGATWCNVHLLSPWSLEGAGVEVRTKTITLVFLPSLGWWASVWPSGEKARVAVHRMVLAWLQKKKAEMSPFPQSIPIQVGPGAHFVAVPTCKEGGGVERESQPSIASFRHRSNSTTFQIRQNTTVGGSLSSS